MKSPFHAWLPKPLIPLGVLILLMPTLALSGVYPANTADMVGGLGTLSEYFMMANYAATIGMFCAYPIMLKVKGYWNSRTILLVSFTATLLLSVVCAETTYPEVIVAASLLIGFFKMFAMIELIIPIMFMISPGGDRARFYTFFYPISIGIGQVSAYVTAFISYEYGWSYVYYVMVIASLVCLAFTLLLYHNDPLEKRIPIENIDGLSLLLLSVSLMLANYVLCFARYENWSDSLLIQGASIGFIITLLGFVSRQNSLTHPLLDLSVLKSKNVRLALFLIFVMGIFFASSSLQSAITSGILRYDAMTSAQLNLWMLPGVFLGGVICFIWFNYQGGFKGIILLGFAAFTLYHVILYLTVSPDMGLKDFHIALIAKGIGMILLFVGLGLYQANKMTMVGMINSGALMIAIRSFVGPALFSAVYAFALYQGQQQHLVDLAGKMDALDPQVTARYMAARQSGLSQGTEVAQIMGARALSGSVQVQAILVTVKEWMGFISIAGFVTLAFVSLRSFQPVNKRRLVNLRRRWRRLAPIPYPIP
ncbi:hypothetical protein BWI96_12255 [Siphonobacter sp. SORGH_AS_0500]|uniref:hypothetical protein n=1 Tax=Siphonobacter sp. SORGH_AS_0500 TaxID=1864824 RepID=UPI000CC6DBCD|nr:hypothetical protein [Siphonobacter sp. SORGH_AS_0500]PKK36180.1 hypothetical protein BWI96_12255 [Siphonobacter sp. SORGH_AS_0500]